MRQWDLDGSGPKERIAGPGPRKAATQVTWARDGNRIVAFSEDNTVWIWDWKGKRFGDGVSFVLEGDRYGWDPARIASDGKTFAATFSDNSVQLWDLDVRPPRPRARIADDGPKDFRGWSAMTIGSDGKSLALGGAKRPIRMIDLSGLQPKDRAKLPNENGSPLTLAFSPDGVTLASGGRFDEIVLVYDVAAAKVRWSMGRPKTWPEFITFSPDGKTLAVSWYHGKVSLADAVTGKQGADLQLGDRPCAVAFSPNSKLLATSGLDGLVAIWDGGQKCHSMQLPGPVHGVAWAPDGRHLATANANGTVFVLRLP